MRFREFIRSWPAYRQLTGEGSGEQRLTATAAARDPSTDLMSSRQGSTAVQLCAVLADPSQLPQLALGGPSSPQSAAASSDDD